MNIPSVRKLLKDLYFQVIYDVMWSIPASLRFPEESAPRVSTVGLEWNSPYSHQCAHLR